MEADLGQLDEIADRLRSLDAVGSAIAHDALPAVLDEAKRTAAAGTTPDGTAWAPRKSDGGRALANVASSITAVVSGVSSAVLVLVLSGVATIHHRAKGNGRHGLPRRQVLFDPANGVPPKMIAAIATAAHRRVARVIGGVR